jgi:hypothetical protein
MIRLPSLFLSNLTYEASSGLLTSFCTFSKLHHFSSQMALALPKRHMSVRELKERARAIEGGAARARVGGGQRGLSRMAVSILRGWLFDHFLHPYPSDEEKEALAHATNLQKGQVIETP